MRSRLAYYMAAFVVILLTHNTILRVKGQPTVHGCEDGDESIEIVTEIQQLFGATYRRQNDQVQQMHELHNASFQEMRNQLDAVKTSLQGVNRRMQNLNVSLQQMKSQLDSVVTSIEALEAHKEECTCRPTVPPRPPPTVPRRLPPSVPPPTVNNWTIFMNRFDGSLNFNRSWVEYRNGFGDIGRGEFWLGNENIHRLTNRNGVVRTLRIEVQLNSNGQWYYADYDTFSIDSESNKYTLHLSGFSGNAGDSLTDTSETRLAFLDGMNFSTFDNDNDNNNNRCAMSYGGGWWFNNCHHACLTCKYNPAYAYFRWYSLRHLSSDGHGKLRAARMMIKNK